MDEPRIALIGCGAVTELSHLRAMDELDIPPAIAADLDEERARAIAARYPGCRAVTDYRQATDAFDAAVVAVPHRLHAPIACDLLDRGKHVLVEKPMATSADDCARMSAAAEASGCVLAVGLMRHFLFGTIWVKRLIESGRLGPVERFEVSEGRVFSWPVKSDSPFTSDGGVLLDTGAHPVDQLVWWLGDDVVELEYRDDSFGGAEADCRLQLTLAAGATGTVELSRTRRLPNTARLEGRDGWVEVGIDSNTVETSPPELSDLAFDGLVGGRLPQQSYYELFKPQLRDFVDAIVQGRAPAVDGTQGAKSSALIERCYASRQPLSLPWLRPEG